MLRLTTRLHVPAFALIVFVLLLPALATAQPQREAVRAPAERTAAASSLFAEIRSFLSILWAETGSGLDPDGGAHLGKSSGTEPGALTSSETGSGLDPNG